ncbi:MAG: threonine--tRNA ligase [Patescibacteria group bacterium]
MANLDNLRHSTSHLLAAAVTNLWPKAKPTLGPPIADGFYYDFADLTISDTDLAKIEKKMGEIVKSWEGFERIEVNASEAKKIFKDNPYKIELIAEFAKAKEKITLYESGKFLDLCRGGHVAKPKEEIKYFKLLSLAGAYWRGSEKNPMLTRIYGTVFPTQKELNKYLWKLEEARKRDHKRIGRELGLFIIPEEVGPGLLIWTPKGATIRREIEKFVVEEQVKRGYQHVYSPHIGKKSLWVTSGHWDLYRDKMYKPMKIDKEDYLVKPMNCPMHMMVYKSELRSYRDLPIRIAENATVYRYEQTGELTGMVRVRYITQDDSHIFCREDQVIDEFIGVLDYTIYLLTVFGIKDYYFRLSLRDPKNKDKYLGSDRVWNEAEAKIESAVKKLALDYKKVEGEAAFYGPKLDVMVQDALGREWQCGTIQVDFMLPERFDLEYIAKDGKPRRPALIHRAPLGSLERWVGLLIEHYAGNFPVWLSPVQVKVLPITARNLASTQKVTEKLTKEGIRVELDARNETLQAKIRDAQSQKIPYMLIVGDKEEKEGVVAVRLRSGVDLGGVKIEDFSARIKEKIANKSLDL